MSDIKIRNDLPEPLPLDVMIDKINKILKTADYFDVYLTYIFLDCIEMDKKRSKQ